MKICEYCGNEYEPSKFTGSKDKQRFCTPSCNKLWHYHNPQGKPCICLNCGKEYRPKSKERNKYCSRECAFADTKGWNVHCLNQKPKEPSPPKPKHIISCVVCGKKFEGKAGRKYCSDECIKEKGRQRAKEKYKHEPVPSFETTCQQCGKIYKTNRPSSRYCSKACAAKVERMAKTEQNQRRRAREKGAYVAPVSRAKIFKRDNWTCQICGKKVNRKLEYPHPMSASIDHVIALANGGTHEPANVQLAHFICNSVKSSNDEGEQLRLFG